MRVTRRNKILLSVLACVLVLPVVTVFGLNRYVNDTSVPLTDSLFPESAPKRLLAIFAHPDDEITVAGSLRRMSEEADAEITIAYLTRGEAADVPKVSLSDLAERRTVEANNAGKVLGADNVELFDFRDSELPKADAAKAQETISALIDEYRPSVVISFDDRVGFYGHPDHAQVGVWVKTVLNTRRHAPDFPVKHFYQATLPESMISVAKDLSPTFRDMYPSDPAQGLPEPTVAMTVDSVASEKRAALDAHVSQVTVLQAVQPAYDKLPSWIYFRILSREYFTQIF
ncbi:PIG-L deacetylase family protein [Catellatospora sichuanensis]|uniref:PIG-L deacetylase family protein n=1 Tax=Catellatospora sichuanensis TaxID=1969805 RepID=UPI001181E641|nr:PIG-L family deacetylase [Catellatospora sichuanensis]